MTIRERIREEKRRLIRLVRCTFALFAAGCIVSLLTPLAKLLLALAILLCWPGFVGFAIVVIYGRLFAFRCPRCGNNWARYVIGPTGLAYLGHWPKLDDLPCCPGCGIELDAPDEAKKPEPDLLS
jgi:hypothetical protein